VRSTLKVFCTSPPLLLLILSTPACRDDVTPPLRFVPTELPEAQVGRPYQATITVVGNRTPVFRIEVVDGELPAGLALHYEPDDNFAEINGIPSVPGESEFTILAACYGTNVTGQTGQQHYELSVSGPVER